MVQIEKAIESRVVQSLGPPRVVVQMSTNNSTGRAVAQIPNQRTMVRRIQCRRVVAHISNPMSTFVLNVPDDFKTTIRGEPFYAFDSGKDDPHRFIFTTTQNSDELEFSAKWAVDGTFAVCPSLFYQLYTMHGIIKDTTVPLVYCLMRSKTEEKYEELFAALKNLNAKLDPHAMQNEKITEFVSYFEATWLGEKNLRGRQTGASFLPQIWCQFENAKEMRQKPKNAVEGWHRAIKGSLGYVHPTIFKGIDFLRREQSAAENKLNISQAGKEFPKNVRYQKNALRIKNIFEGYQNNRIELAIIELSNNFDFVLYFKFSPVIYPISLC